MTQYLKDVDQKLVDIASAALFANEFNKHDSSMALDIADIKDAMSHESIPVLIRGAVIEQNTIQNATNSL